MSYLPTLGCSVLLLVLVWAGAPSADLRLDRAWDTAAHLGVGELVLLWLAITLVSVVLHPLQLWLVRLLEGQWPRWLGPVTDACVRRQERKRKQVSRRAVHTGDRPTRHEGNQIGAARTELELRFPPLELPPMPTALGNVLVALRESAGTAHGLDAVAVWPRIYPRLAAGTKSVVDDHRNIMDMGCRLSVTVAATAVATTVLVWKAHDAWMLLPGALLLLSRLAYRGAVSSAIAYGIALNAAIDTHRFELYRTLRLPLPENPATERTFNSELSRHWRQGGLHPHVAYEEPDNGAPSGTPAPGPGGP
ncbi:hypothetical protein [Streptomyces sp. NPDC002463]|uniref:hypothetical protein n=1 Tax=Streptomyces sp. NPDC002463 TaxID=3364645 RepID=UPI0036916A66